MKDLTILFVEDEPILNNAITDFLKHIYKNVISVYDGLEGKRILETRKDIDILITDMNLPNVNGAELIDLMYRNDNIKNVPTILITAYCDIVCEYENYQCVTILKKPLMMDKLRDKINEEVENHSCNCYKLSNIHEKVDKIIKLIRKDED